GFNGNLFFIFFILLVSGLVNVFLGNNTSGLFFKVYTGLTLSYFFYYYVIVDFEYDIEKLFSWYLKGAYVVALIGIFQFISFKVGFYYGYEYHWIFNKWGFVPGGMFGIRVNSVFAEPTHLGTVLSAAFFISVYNMLQKETFYLTRFQSLVIITVYILSFSSLGQTGIFLTFLLLAINFGLVRYVVVLVPAAIILFNSLYNNLADFKGRLDGLIYLFSGQQFKVGQTHGSSFILYNNYVVAMQNFKTNFVFGTGIGSHPIAFEKYSIAKNIKIWGFNLNSADANSMLLRLISETGLFGVIIFLFIIIKCYVRRDTMHETYHWLVSNAILIMMLLNLFRQGHYFLNGFPFFVMLYCFNYFSYKQSRENSLLYTAED
ncbi:MAG TPA: hypothetical protein PL029_07895, partial [Bacteroidia bacterium]|nr:hypothetical protein [Bacteroidia bacterium]